jgi:hypothetical protein
MVEDSIDEASRQIHGGGEEVEVLGARDFDGAELLQVRREPLGVEEDKFSRAQMFDQTEQRDL